MKSKKLIWAFVIGVLAYFIGLVFEKQITMFVVGLRFPLLDYLLTWVTHAGSVFVVFIFMSTLFLWEERKREWIPTLWTTFAVTIGLVYLIKILIVKGRPFEVLDIAVLTKTNMSSIISGHAAIAFSAVPLLDREFRRLKWFWVCFAFLVAFSRVYVGAHYIGDVILGGVVGFSIGVLFVYIESKYKIFKKNDNKIRA